MPKGILAKMVKGAADATGDVAMFNMRERALDKREERLREIQVADRADEREHQANVRSADQEFRKEENRKNRESQEQQTKDRIAAGKKQRPEQAYKIASELAAKTAERDYDYEGAEKAKKEGKPFQSFTEFEDSLKAKYMGEMGHDYAGIKTEKKPEPVKDPEPEKTPSGDDRSNKDWYKEDPETARKARIDRIGNEIKSMTPLGSFGSGNPRGKGSPVSASDMDEFINAVVDAEIESSGMDDNEGNRLKILKAMSKSDEPKLKNIRNRILSKIYSEKK